MQISFKDLKTSDKIHNQLQCESESLVCVDFLRGQTVQFEKLTENIKQDQDWTYKQLFQIEVDLDQILVDFESRDTEARQKLWHIRLDKFLKEMECSGEMGELEVIQADVPRYWLEEAHNIELTKDSKHDSLNDIVDRIDLIYKAYHQCTTEEALTLMNCKVTEVYPRLAFERIKTEMKSKLTGEENEGFSVVEYL